MSASEAGPPGAVRPASPCRHRSDQQLAAGQRDDLSPGLPFEAQCRENLAEVGFGPRVGLILAVMVARIHVAELVCEHVGGARRPGSDEPAAGREHEGVDLLVDRLREIDSADRLVRVGVPERHVAGAAEVDVHPDAQEAREVPVSDRPVARRQVLPPVDLRRRDGIAARGDGLCAGRGGQGQRERAEAKGCCRLREEPPGRCEAFWGPRGERFEAFCGGLRPEKADRIFIPVNSRAGRPEGVFVDDGTPGSLTKTSVEAVRP